MNQNPSSHSHFSRNVVINQSSPPSSFSLSHFLHAPLLIYTSLNQNQLARLKQPQQTTNSARNFQLVSARNFQLVSAPHFPPRNAKSKGQETHQSFKLPLSEQIMSPSARLIDVSIFRDTLKAKVHQSERGKDLDPNFLHRVTFAYIQKTVISLLIP